MEILVTGGLGYIGSHVAHKLGKKAIIIDNQVNSSLEYKKYLPLSTVYTENLNTKSLNKVFSKHNIKGVIHLAGLKAVNDSIKLPLKYYDQNVKPTIELLECMDKFKIYKFIFSSSATVYGDIHRSPLNENMSLSSTNPYGSTKIIIEQLINDYSKSNQKFRAISLRYFNPLGADARAGLFEKPLGEPLNLVPILIDSIKRKKIFKIYGNDYPTKDGTCIRDYIHVKDIALAHLLSLKKLSRIKGHTCLNLGLGKGKSVLEIVKLFEKVNGISVKYLFDNRRLGDAGISFSSNKKAIKILGWNPKYEYSDMLKDAWDISIKK